MGFAEAFVRFATGKTEKLPVYAVHTPRFEILLREFFLPSLPDDIDLRLQPYQLDGAGDFGDPTFVRTIHHKADLMLRSVRENAGRVIMWSDIDIQFFAPFIATVRKIMETHDICFQTERLGSDEVNTGLVAMRCEPRVEAFIEQVATTMRSTGETEQPVINRLLRESLADGLRVGRFPASFYAKSHGRLPRIIVLHHANCTVPRDGRSSIDLKLEQLREVRAQIDRERWKRRWRKLRARFMQPFLHKRLRQRHPGDGGIGCRSSRSDGL